MGFFKMIIKPLFLLTALLSSQAVLVEAIEDFKTNKGQRPVGKDRPNELLPPGQVLHHTTPRVNRAALAREDDVRDLLKMPFRFAVPFKVSIVPKDWEQLSDGIAVWRQRIHAKRAASINLGFETFDMPEGASLFVYTLDNQVTLGPFTSEDNGSGGLWTRVVEGYSEVMIEVNVAPTTDVNEVQVELSSVNSGYRGFKRRGASNRGRPGRMLSGSCNVDVVCSDGDSWRREIPSVADYTINGFETCTGALVNNVAQDMKPFFLTAHHCGAHKKPGSLVVYWNYESTVCDYNNANGRRAASPTTRGSMSLAHNRTSDFALILLDSSSFDPIAWDLTFAGWDSRGNQPANTTCIHHPNNDEKAISFDYDPPTFTTEMVRVNDWDKGTTEPGSSGSPLFDQDHRIIGQLNGGRAACGNNREDIFGRFDKSWGRGLKTHLDPNGVTPGYMDTLVAQTCATVGDCDDNDLCTIDSCYKDICVNMPKTCPPGQVCKIDGSCCVAGTCKPNDSSATCHVVEGTDTNCGTPCQIDLGPCELVSGSWIRVSLFSEEEKDYKISVPANKGAYCFTYGKNGDADLYINFGSRPTLRDYLVRGFSANSKEATGPTTSASEARTLYAMLHAYNTFNDVKLKCRAVDPTCAKRKKRCSNHDDCCSGKCRRKGKCK